MAVAVFTVYQRLYRSSPVFKTTAVQIKQLLYSPKNVYVFILTIEMTQHNCGHKRTKKYIIFTDQ